MNRPGAAAGPPGTPGRLIGGFLVIAATALVAALETFLVGLRVGNLRLPVSLLIAAALHPLLTRLMRDATASRGAMVLPFLVWIVIVFPLGARRSEGDVILAGNNWISTVYLIVGVGAFAITLGLLLPARRRVGGNLGRDGSA